MGKYRYVTSALFALVFCLHLAPVHAEVVCSPPSCTTYNVVVQAVANAIDGGAPLTVANVSKGDTVSIAANPASATWSMGHPSSGCLITVSNAAGLLPGQCACCQVADYGGISFPTGALVARIDGGAWFLIGTGSTFVAQDSGQLQVVIWDIEADDNSGSIDFVVQIQGAIPVTLYSFCADTACTNGAFVYPTGGGELVQGVNGDLYGTSWGGGSYGYGTVYRISPGGKLTTLHNFTGGGDGGNPYFGLMLATDGDLYGVTDAGGLSNRGTLFKITVEGALTTLHQFKGGQDGSNPYAGLVEAAGGELYGTTTAGGTSGAGTVFKITRGGVLASLYSFSGSEDGSFPAAPLVRGANGSLYGTTYRGGSSGTGTIFKITPGGELSTLHSFDGTDGGATQAALVQASNGDLYGTSKFGGGYVYGTVFKMTPAGKFTTLYAFNGSDGGWPNSSLIQATDGQLYGTTEIGGANGAGTIFRVTPNGGVTSLYAFDSSYGGGVNSVYAGLLQATNGDLYGTTERGGAAGDGTVFRLSVGLGPFVETVPAYARVGSTIRILGNQLRGATSVAFNGAVAQGSCASLACSTYNVVVQAVANAIDGGEPLTVANVVQGDRITIAADPMNATWDMGVPSAGCQITVSNAAGLLPGQCACCQMADYGGISFPTGALVARIDGGAWFLVGTGSAFVAQNSGTLQVVVWDLYAGDNAGSINFSIQVESAAKFTVVSATEILAEVPVGATTGVVEVVTPDGTLSSNTVLAIESSADVYGPAPAELHIPALAIGNALYSNVVLSAGSIITAPSGKSPDINLDIYDPASNQLTVPVVRVGGSTYFNAVITVAKLSSIGSVRGADTFDGSQLHMPCVSADTKTYDDIILDISRANVLAVFGGMPGGVCDQYDPATGHLTVSAVQYGSMVYTNVILAISPVDVVSVGSTGLLRH